MYKHVYAFQNVDNNIKIGISKQPNTRRRQIENASGLKIVNEFISEPTPNAKKIEELVFKHFSIYRGKGEWFFNLNMEAVKLHLKFYDYSDQLGIY